MIPTITFYTTDGCRLCKAAYKEIMIAQSAASFHLKTIDIQNEYENYEKYKNDIPVILLDGKEIGRHRSTSDLIIIKIMELSRNA